MMYKIFTFFMIPMAAIAIALSFYGVHSIEFGSSYYSFIRTVTTSFNGWKIEIPSIPSVPFWKAESIDSSGGILEILRNFVNFLIQLLNFSITSVNVLVLVVNQAINIIQFVLTILWSVKDFISSFSTLRIAIV